MALLLAIIAAVYIASSNDAPMTCHAFQPGAGQIMMRHRNAQHQHQQFTSSALHEATSNSNVDSSSPSPELSLSLLSDAIDFQSLMVMDVVLFQRNNNNNSNNSNSQKLELGAVQENGNIAPLSTWTLESSYTSATNDMMEFVVDEEDMYPGLSGDSVRVLKVLDGSVMGYGSRQVGGGKGPGNPHGEESEMLYYVDRGVAEGEYQYLEVGGASGSEGRRMMIDVVVNTDLEVLW